ncbi:MAG TPA: tetraacyldisaccharide 4'-kinase [Terracidiphilus sp.]|nr:tetraacyldisaccharide 4'-kinase [Terracidiphilus sp.]
MRRPWLAPFTPFYAAGLALRKLCIENGWEPVRRLRWPVVSIGNLSTGGSGKTPLTIALAKALTRRVLRVDVLSRGYGRQSRHAARVDPEGAAENFGDEPLLMALETGVPVYVAGQRYEAGLLAEVERSADSRFGLHLLDDGFQHRQLHRDVDVLLLNRRDLTDSLLPAGNLREPLKAARRATIIAIPTPDESPSDASELETALRNWGWQGPIWRLHRNMEIPPVTGSVVAFCGIARPEQFFFGLETAGLHIAARIVFPDHHLYTARNLDRVVTAARRTGATALITTEKDSVRLGKLSSAFPESLPLKTARLRIEIEHENEAIASLISRLALSPPHPSL